MPRKSQAEKVHDRTGADLPINSRVAVAIVDDPYSSVGEKISVMRSVRHDPLADMFTRGLIDQALYSAGRKWQALYERRMVGSVGAIDPTKEAVDGGRMRDPLTDSQMKATDELYAANLILGRVGKGLMADLLGECLSMAALADKYDCKTARRMNFLSIRIRECLEDLAKLWGFVGTAKRAY